MACTVCVCVCAPLCVCVCPASLVRRQRPLSAFAISSIFVVTGVSTDNIFVVHETWSQSALLRNEGRPVDLPYRIRWTIIQSARPLLIADGTTAFSLFISCASTLPAIFQFGV